MRKIIVAGIGTGVGKTIVSAILTLLYEGDYWKPIQCGDERKSDTVTLKKWLGNRTMTLHPPAYSFHASLSPHHAARLENYPVKLEAIVPPATSRPLIIESVGGILVPLTTKILSIDLFKSWDCQWILVSKHYLGSINHTLLSIEALQQRHIPILGLIFNGKPDPDSETAILGISKIPLLGRLLPETYFDQQTLHKYVKQWKPHFSALLR